MREGDRVRILWCPANAEAVGSIGVVVAYHENLGGFGADVVEVRYETGGKMRVMPFAPENLEELDYLAPASKDRTA